MKLYYSLQFRIFNRSLKEIGIPLGISYILLPVVFFLVSLFLYSQGQIADYIFISFPIWLMFKLGNGKRCDFIKLNFVDFRKLRILDNLIVSSPFVLVLLFNNSFLFIASLVVISVLMAFFEWKKSLEFTIPTPFSNKPFEFSIGFRKSYLFVLLLIILSVISVSVNNISLGLFALAMIFVLSISYYTYADHEYFIWIYRFAPSKFILNKIVVGLAHSSILSLPTIAILIIGFWSEAIIIIPIMVLGYLYLTTTILAKYASYPDEIEVPQGILIAVSFIFPPILLGLIPFFYSQSVNKVRDLLI